MKVTFVDDDTPIYQDADPVHLYELMVAVTDHEPTEPALDFGAWGELPDGSSCGPRAPPDPPRAW